MRADLVSYYVPVT